MQPKSTRSARRRRPSRAGSREDPPNTKGEAPVFSDALDCGYSFSSNPPLPYDVWERLIFPELSASLVARIALANRACWRFWAWECLHDTQVSWWSHGSKPPMVKILKKIAAQSHHHRLRNIKTIDLRGIDSVRGAPKILRCIAEICPDVRSVSTSRCNRVQSMEFVDFLRAIKVEKLSLSGTHPKTVQEIFLRCDWNRITSLELEKIDLDDILPYMPRKMHLKTLKIHAYQPRWARIATRDASPAIYQKLAILSQETLKILDINEELWRWTPELISAVGACRGLQTLKLTTTGAVNYGAEQDFLRYFASSLPLGLKRIEIDLAYLPAFTATMPLGAAVRRNRHDWSRMLVGLLASILGDKCEVVDHV